MTEKADNPSQKCSEYKPTKAEAKLLEVMLNPAYRLKSISEVCEIAGISRRQYYNIFAKPEFVDHYKQESKALASKHIGQVLNAFVKEASRGSFQHGKVLLEMAGLYQETTRKEVTGAGGAPIENNVNIVSRTAGMTEEQKIELAKQLRKLRADEEEEIIAEDTTDTGTDDNEQPSP